MGYTQEAMAESLEVGLKAYSSWEADKNPPSDVLTVAVKLERLTGIPRQWFIGWMDDEPTTPERRASDYSSVVSLAEHRAAKAAA